MRELITDPGQSRVVTERTEEYLAASSRERAESVDRMMIWLLAAEWAGMIAAAAIISPRAWDGLQSSVHPHLWAAILAGPLFILPTIGIALLYPARELTRHAIAVAQMLVSALLIDVTGGRIETHFHVFGSLAFLALYRDWRVLITASLVTALDHVFRGIWWPQSIYGIVTVSPWRWVEHAWWVAFEDLFLLVSMKTSSWEERLIARNKAILYEGANHDVLTGLANRRLLQETFDAVIEKNPDSKSALLFIDLDRFKQANDTLGHSVGDRLLVSVAARFTGVVGSSGTLARVGGDEFVILLEDTLELENAESLGRQILQCLGEPFHIDEHDLLLSASVGISLYPQHGTALAPLQESADRAMYLAKSYGRNRCVVFSGEVSSREEKVDKIENDLPGALARGEFYLHFQPLIRRDGRLAGFEALLRWEHPELGAVAPSEFIPLAEKSGKIAPLGNWVLTEACLTCRTWNRTGEPSIGIAVNVSPIEFEQLDYPEKVFDVLSTTGIDPSLLTLELTEGVLVRDPGRARAHLTRLRRSGIRIALDDFGTGYSSLSYLADLPADLIKLDRTFLNSDMPGSTVVIASVVSLAHRLGLTVVGEGVETGAQKDNLAELMCDQFQGYYFSRPIPASAVVELLDAQSSKRGKAPSDESQEVLILAS